uniref:Uncharacterized protein n=1 Tax=Leptobrachium leishanense TaxID=445787 RepID=A0A8C5PN56_9ANUR
MASADLRDEVTCSLCTDIYTDPVTLNCGHSFCHECITSTWDFQSSHPDKSAEHKVLEYYCCEDAACICVSCSLAGEHRGHQVETLNEASEKKKEKLRNILQKLTSQREEAEKSVQNLEELRRQVQGKAAGVTEDVTALIRNIREEPEALEKQVLNEISRQEEQVSLRVSDLIRPLEIKKEELSRKMSDIEKLCDMMDPITVLQEKESDRDDYCDAEEDTEEDTERRNIMTHDVGDLDVDLISVTLYSGLAGIVTRIKRQCRTLGASDMSLDINTAGNDVCVSGDLKTVSWSGLDQRRPDTPERFQYSQVLSSRSFSSGRHYWEVKVSESGRWMVGVVYPSIERRGWKNRWFKNHYYVRHDSKKTRLPHPPSCQRLGISLDYEAGRLSFYELCEPIRHLHTFTAVFAEPSENSLTLSVLAGFCSNNHILIIIIIVLKP